MLYLGRRRTLTWVATVFTPPREVFVVMEQILALPPFTFRVIDTETAEAVQDRVNGFFGQWRTLKHPRDLVRVRCELTDQGTRVTVTAIGPRSSHRRALNLLRILTRGAEDSQTIYRTRTIPPGPCTIPQSWAGTGYPVFQRPDHGAPRGAAVRPASALVALEQQGHWVRVRVGAGETASEGWIEADQLIPDLGRVSSPAGTPA